MREREERIQSLYTHPLYAQTLALLKEQEKDRLFCRHDEAHFLAVARLSYIKWLEAHVSAQKENPCVSQPHREIKNCEEIKEILYAAALLHDIGRARQYADGTPHEEASVMLAQRILPDAGFTKEEQKKICALIGAHRTVPDNQTDSMDETEDARLARLFYEADKQSRPCYCCPAAALCNWPRSRRNHIPSV